MKIVRRSHEHRRFMVFFVLGLLLGTLLPWLRRGFDRLVGKPERPRFRGTEFMEYRARPTPNYSALMLAARITLAHFSVSSAISLPKSAGEPGEFCELPLSALAETRTDSVTAGHLDEMTRPCAVDDRRLDAADFNRQRVAITLWIWPELIFRE